MRIRTKQKKDKKKTLQWMTGTALMIAVTLVLANTPLGRINLPFLTATTLHIPVIIATLALGLEAGILTGLTFGIHSLIANFSNASFFAPFFLNPFVSIVPRVLFPVFVYLIAQVMKKIAGIWKKSNWIAYVTASAVGTALHTTMVMGMIYVLNHQQIEQMLTAANVPGVIAERGVGAGIVSISLANVVPEMIVASVIAPAIAVALERAFGKIRITR